MSERLQVALSIAVSIAVHASVLLYADGLVSTSPASNGGSTLRLEIAAHGASGADHPAAATETPGESDSRAPMEPEAEQVVPEPAGASESDVTKPAPDPKPAATPTAHRSAQAARESKAGLRPLPKPPKTRTPAPEKAEKHIVQARREPASESPPSENTTHHQVSSMPDRETKRQAVEDAATQTPYPSTMPVSRSSPKPSETPASRATPAGAPDPKMTQAKAASTDQSGAGRSQPPPDEGASRTQGAAETTDAGTEPATDTAGLVPPTESALPLYHLIPRPPYPQRSRDLGEQGTVIISVLVGKDGSVLKARVDRSSGYPRLDGSALDTVRERWRFKPGTRDGRPVTSRVRVPIRFRISDVQG